MKTSSIQIQWDDAREDVKDDAPTILFVSPAGFVKGSPNDRKIQFCVGNLPGFEVSAQELLRAVRNALPLDFKEDVI